MPCPSGCNRPDCADGRPEPARKARSRAWHETWLEKPGVTGRYLTRICWPTWSEVELTPGLSASSAATVVPLREAIEPNVSPL